MNYLINYVLIAHFVELIMIVLIALIVRQRKGYNEMRYREDFNQDFVSSYKKLPIYIKILRTLFLINVVLIIMYDIKYNKKLKGKR